MKTLVKNFSQFVNESVHEEPKVIAIDLIEEYPDYYSREARIENSEEDEDEYTDSITTTLTATLINSDPERQRLVDLGLDDYEVTANHWNEFTDPSFKTKPVKVKLEYNDEELGYGTYGPYGGGHEVVVYCGINEWSRAAVLSKFDELLATTDYFAQ